MRAACITFAIGTCLACSGEPFTVWSSSGGEPASAGSGGSSSSGGASEPSRTQGGASSGHSAGGERNGGGGASTPVGEPDDPSAGAATALGGASAGGEGGEASEPSCRSQAMGDWELGYFPELREPTSQDIHPFFQATNRGQKTATLDRMVIRYYFTNDSGLAETATCYWVTGDRCSLARFAFGDVPSPTADASRYLEVSFPGASQVKVTPGKLEVRVGFRTGSDPNVQTNDYSFDPNAAPPSVAAPFPYKRWAQATLYLDGELVWGAEPCAASGRTTGLGR